MAKDDNRQDLLRKQLWVIETIRKYSGKDGMNGGISFEELNYKWEHEIWLSGGESLNKRTFERWRNSIWERFNISIENDRKNGYLYYIGVDSLDEKSVVSWLYNTYSVSNALNDSLEIRNRILLEPVPSGEKQLQTLMDAMKENRVLRMGYRGYHHAQVTEFEVQPYCVKLFRQRWYMVALGCNEAYAEMGPRVYALDRINTLALTEKTFRMPENWDAEQYFSGCFGVIPDADVKTERVVLKVDAWQANYIRDLPLHESQHESERNRMYSIFTYRLRPTFDFRQELLSHGSAVEVLEPKWFRDDMAKMIRQMGRLYRR